MSKEKSKTSCVTPEFVCSYPNLFVAKAYDDNPAKKEFSVVALFDCTAKDKKMAELKECARQALIKKFGADEKKWPKNLHSPFRDQADREKEVTDEKTGETEMQMPDGYVKGNVFLNLKNSKMKPQIFDRAKRPITDPAEIYPGVKGRAAVNASAYLYKGKAGVSFYIDGFQKTGEGKPLSGKVDVESSFTVLEEVDAESSADELF